MEVGGWKVEGGERGVEGGGWRVEDREGLPTRKICERFHFLEPISTALPNASLILRGWGLGFRV